MIPKNRDSSGKMISPTSNLNACVTSTPVLLAARQPALHLRRAAQRSSVRCKCELARRCGYNSFTAIDAVILPNRQVNFLDRPRLYPFSGDTYCDSPTDDQLILAWNCAHLRACFDRARALIWRRPRQAERRALGDFCNSGDSYPRIIISLRPGRQEKVHSPTGATLPPSDAASEGKPNRGWATALPSPTQGVLPLSMNAPPRKTFKISRAADSPFSTARPRARPWPAMTTPAATRLAYSSAPLCFHNGSLLKLDCFCLAAFVQTSHFAGHESYVAW